jgi:hypothetical protein
MNTEQKRAKLAEAVNTIPSDVIETAKEISIHLDGESVRVSFQPATLIATSRRPNPANGAPRPRNHNPVA